VKELQSILLEDIEISLPGFSIRRMALNQHMPRVEKLSEHRHDHHQWLLYLRGRGVQRIERDTVEVGRGTVLWIEPGVPHRFEKDSDLRPVCLVIDFETEESTAPVGPGLMTDRALQEVEQLLIDIHEEERRASARPVAMASLILQTTELLDGAIHQSPGAGPGGITGKQIEKAIRRIGLDEASPGVIARHCQCTLDHLNRQLRNECGKTVGGMLNEIRLETVNRLLVTTTKSVGEVGAAIGVDDQNYFSRWFRKQTGKTPSQWRVLRSDS